MTEKKKKKQNDGVELVFDTFGDPADPAMLLISGMSSPRDDWPKGFCTRLAGRGFHVIRFDNRDSGESTHFDHVPDPDLRAVLDGDLSGVPYTLRDMAADGLAVLDELGIPAAHAVGASLGGMVVQELAIHEPDRLLSVCSIMSTTGDLSVGAPKGVNGPPPPGALEPRLTRQMAAVFASGDRTKGLHAVTLPTVVIHGDADRSVDVSGGRATAAAIPGARLLIVPGMGHGSVPQKFWTTVIDAIEQNARLA